MFISSINKREISTFNGLMLWPTLASASLESWVCMALVFSRMAPDTSPEPCGLALERVVFSHCATVWLPTLGNLSSFSLSLLSYRMKLRPWPPWEEICLLCTPFAHLFKNSTSQIPEFQYIPVNREISLCHTLYSYNVNFPPSCFNNPDNPQIYKVNLFSICPPNQIILTQALFMCTK